MISPRWTLIFSTVLSTLTLLILIVSLPLFFNRMLKSNSLMLSQLSVCQTESHSLFKELSKVQHLRFSRQTSFGSCCSCQQGGAGIAGPPGRDGEDGRPGRLGVNGKNGRDGRYIAPPERNNEESCQKCPPAPRGFPGDPGNKGPRGPPGKSGQSGVPGKAGRKGPPGPDGVRGVHGNIGKTGARGDTGRVLMGAPAGPPGPVGGIGPRGKAGTDGMDGSPGSIGLKGMRGIEGSRGPSGQPGPIGVQGAKGFKGFDGSCAHCVSLERPEYPSQSNEQKRNESMSVPSTIPPSTTTSPSSTSTTVPSTTHDYDYNERIYETPEEHINSIPEEPKHGYDSKEIEKYYGNSREVTDSPSTTYNAVHVEQTTHFPRDQHSYDVHPPKDHSHEPYGTPSTPEYGGNDGSFLGYGALENDQSITDYGNPPTVSPSLRPTVYSNPVPYTTPAPDNYGRSEVTVPRPNHRNEPSLSEGYDIPAVGQSVHEETRTLPPYTSYEQPHPTQTTENYSNPGYSIPEETSNAGYDNPHYPSNPLYNSNEKTPSYSTTQEPKKIDYSTPQKSSIPPMSIPLQSSTQAYSTPQEQHTPVYETPVSEPRKSSEEYGGSDGSFTGYGGPDTSEEIPRTIPGIRIDQSEYKSEEVYAGPSYPSVPLSPPSTPSPHPSTVPSPSIHGYDETPYESSSYPSSQYSSNPLPSSHSSPSAPPRASLPTVPTYNNVYPARPQYPQYRNTFSFPQMMQRELVYPPPGHNTLPANYQAYRAIPRSGWKIEGTPNRQFVPSI